jgi:hypothetical protein
MKSAIPIALAAFALMLPIGQSVAGSHFDPGVPYYFDSFDPAQKPWTPGQELNYEEVYKNYAFVEIIFSASGKEITVNGYVNNNKTDSVQYRLDSDGALHRINGDERP